MYTIKMLSQEDLPLLMNVAEDVFDNPIDESLVREFLNDSRHHIVAAVSEGQVVGFASAVHYIHPDKPPELWINEVGVTPIHQRQGVASAVLAELLKLARSLGCRSAWVLTERDNEPANRLYQSTHGRVGSDQTVMYEFDLLEEK